jgi:putative SOS response-associated peptidase YedK
MCGRYNLAELSWRELRGLMLGIAPAGWRDDGDEAPPIPQRYNVTPTSSVPIVQMLRDEEGQLSPAFARWGLIPRWHRKPVKEWKATTINARVETVATAPSFRDAYKNARCIVPMAGYYEWATLQGKHRPFYIHPAGNEPALLVAGLWSEVDLPDYKGLTVTILTEPAVGMIDDRQPVIIDADGARAWLDGVPIEDVPRQPITARTMHRVEKSVGSVRNEGPGLILPVADED